jgi:hypothetical protein
LSSSDWCSAHDPSLPDEERFGSAIQAARAGASVKPRVLKIREAGIAKVEAELDSMFARAFEALNAERAVVHGSGEDSMVELVPDFPTRLRAFADIWDRLIGKPPTLTEVSGPDGAPIQTEATLDIADPETRKLAHDLLKRRAAGDE